MFLPPEANLSTKNLVKLYSVWRQHRETSDRNICRQELEARLLKDFERFVRNASVQKRNFHQTVYLYRSRTMELAVFASSPVVGSSRNKIGGSSIISIPTFTRLRSPPETPRINSFPTFKMNLHLTYTEEIVVFRTVKNTHVICHPEAKYQ